MQSRLRHLLTPALACLAAALHLGAVIDARQLPGQLPRMSPTPPAGNIVRVDVIVTDSDGQPVRGLTRDDFDLFDAGRRQPIAAFAEVELGPTETPPVPLPDDVRLDVADNAHATSDRAVVLIIDDLHTSGSQTAGLQGLAMRVTERLGPGVPIGVIFTGGRAGLELTTDLALLGQTIGRVDADERPVSPALSDEDRDRQVFEPIADAAVMLQSEDRRRRAFVWISNGARYDAGATTGPHARRFLQAAREASIAVYAIDPIGDSGLEALVGRTGGSFSPGSGDAEALTDRIVQDQEHHYFLSFEAGSGAGFAIGAGQRDDYAQSLAVHVRREGTVVRHRLGPGGPQVPQPTLEEQMESRLTRVVPASDAQLRLFATPFPSTGRDVPVMVAVEMSLPRGLLEAEDLLLRDEVEYEVHAVDLESRRVRQRDDTIDVVALRPRSAARSSADAVSYEFLTWMDLPPGHYQLRVSARSKTLDLDGGVYLTLDVPDSSALPLVLGGIVLGYAAEAASEQEQLLVNVGQSARSLRPRGFGGSTAMAVFAPSGADSGFLIDPAFDRRFERWDALKLVFDVAHRDRSPDAAALVEVRDSTGRIVHSSRPAVGERDKEQVEIDLPIAQFSPGAYWISARAISGTTETRRDASFVINGEPLPPGAEDPLGVALAAAAAARDAGPPPVETSESSVAPPPLRPDLDLASRLGDGTNADALASAGWERYGQGDVEGAQVKLAEAMATGTESPWIHYAYGLAEFALGQFEVAARSWVFVLERQPDYKRTYLDLTDAYLLLDRTAEAVDVLSEARRRWPDDAEMHNAMGVVQYSRRQFDDAIDAFGRAVEVTPNDGLSYFNLGRAYQGRMVQWQRSRNTLTSAANDTLADRDRQSAVAAYTRALELGGFFEWDAREALRVLIR